MFFSALIYFSVHRFIFQCTNLFFSAQIYFQCTNIFFSAQIYFSVHKYISSAQIYFSVHKFIFQCTNLFSTAQIHFPVHKYIFQRTNIFFSAQIYFPVHKYISSARICFSVHKFIFQCTNIFPVHEYVFQCTNIFSSAQICNWRPGYHCLPAPNWLPFCTTKTITTRPEGLFNSILESMFCPQDELVPRGLLLLVKLDSSYQIAKIAEIFYLNQQGALEKQLDPVPRVNSCPGAFAAVLSLIVVINVSGFITQLVRASHRCREVILVSK